MLQLKNTTTHHRKVTTVIKVAYTTKPDQHAREYTATVGQHRITLDKEAGNYYPWCVFIVHFDGPTYTESNTLTTALHTYASTLAEAKQIAADFIESKLSAPVAV